VAALLAQLMLKAHLQADGGAAFPELTRPLAALPTRLGDWQGRDLPDLASLRARLPFADDVLSRGYTLAEGPAARLYAVYSRAGADREHHPEICVREVGGAAEDPAFAATLYLDAAQRRPVRRFRFRMGTEPAVAVYYWHYTLDAPVREGESLLQGLHRRLSRRAPSVTVQVATTAPPEELPRVERTLLPAVDAALTAAVLPATARPGCERLPIRKVLSIED
jgi:hypothetical protein